ncbi:hypothetical protein [Halorubrum ezzemoulense]|jgi:hypothetical protein|uniref:Secreted protein n=1 Tax=Halorubrum ezzemoulense TaxID=337243 RepID=A0ABT4Z849_HALEZ|nr:hypothetical protein [Halorubrum ezzemoulense]MDB2226037.1 hypothetical protein [Halorubrum ezzemoulense]MDB2239311.1 hypothetical protein [Halorubrum ezzemoulense]MDB2249780.1 hypothetical protein [Halorubrum ezzemoulense]MDB2253296.1 hypothetical protein [Halorubrum ezzemoulense]MDB2293650.1 hypothetical protein [Halorubrum ezzemoulense]
MTRATKLRIAGSALVAATALIGFVGVVVGDGGNPVNSAVDALETAKTAATLTGEVAFLAAGGALIGLGVGAVIASGATYWYQNKQIGGRLK